MNEKTKKIKKKVNKKDLWNSFKNEITDNEIECVYTTGKQREICDCCESILMVSEEGFLNCTNKMCGVIYKDMLDHSAEWRYYGADDSNVGDPTRAGPPINPLLRESSFGCKVICNSNATYEMRKIKRYSEWQSMPYKEKSQYDEFQRITILASQSGIPKLIIDDAMRYHKLISDNCDLVIAQYLFNQ